MSDEWQVGDLAVCVDASVNRTANHNGGLELNKVYRVSNVIVDSGGVGLNFEELPPPTDCISRCFWAHRFRKIKPDTEVCEAEFTTLIKRMKPAKVKA